MHGIDEVAQITPEAIQLPDHEGIAWLEGLKTGEESRAILPLAAGTIRVDALRCDPRGGEGIELQIQGLDFFALGDARIAE